MEAVRRGRRLGDEGAAGGTLRKEFCLIYGFRRRFGEAELALRIKGCKGL